MSFKDARKGRGLYRAEVVRSLQVTPHMRRVTVAGEDLRRLPNHGYDHWFRLFLPQPGQDVDFSRVPDRLGMASYLKFLTSPSGTRPIFRSYTVREFRPDAGELDIDFVVHGELGVAGPWAMRAQAGDEIALIDQGCGFDLLDDADYHVLAGDESALPAILGILRDLPRDAEGTAIIEVPDLDDMQPSSAPENFEILWLAREGSREPAGRAALDSLRAFVPEHPETLSAYVVGERTLATEGRRHLVGLGVPKNRISFVGYWREGKAQP
ncbi:siderophore-interacting protein [Actinomycetaceae bacterium L2_0104]